MLRRTYGQIRVWKMWCDYDTTATAAVDAVSSSSQCTLMLLQQLSLLLLPSHSLFSFPKWENFDLALTQLTHFALHLVDYHCCCLKSDSLFITDCIMVHTLNPNFIFCGCIFFFSLWKLLLLPSSLLLYVLKCSQYSRKILRFMQDWFENPKDKTISLFFENP